MTPGNGDDSFRSVPLISFSREFKQIISVDFYNLEDLETIPLYEGCGTLFIGGDT